MREREIAKLLKEYELEDGSLDGTKISEDLKSGKLREFSMHFELSEDSTPTELNITFDDFGK